MTIAETLQPEKVTEIEGPKSKRERLLGYIIEDLQRLFPILEQQIPPGKTSFSQTLVGERMAFRIQHLPGLKQPLPEDILSLRAKFVAEKWDPKLLKTVQAREEEWVRENKALGIEFAPGFPIRVMVFFSRLEGEGEAENLKYVYLERVVGGDRAMPYLFQLETGEVYTYKVPCSSAFLAVEILRKKGDLNLADYNSRTGFELSLRNMQHVFDLGEDRTTGLRALRRLANGLAWAERLVTGVLSPEEKWKLLLDCYYPNLKKKLQRICLVGLIAMMGYSFRSCWQPEAEALKEKTVQVVNDGSRLVEKKASEWSGLVKEEAVELWKKALEFWENIGSFE